MVEEKKIIDLTNIIKNKPELRSLHTRFVKEKIIDYLKKNPKTERKFLDTELRTFLKSKEYSVLKKNIRKHLRITYGLFLGDDKSRKLSVDKESLNYELFLLKHKSTKERFPHYNKLYSELKKIIGDFSKVFDVGCGLNPFSYNFLKKNMGHDVNYYCCDLPSENIGLINKFFSKSEITGFAFGCDIIKDYGILIEKINSVKPDVVIMLKLLDTIESVKKHYSKELISKILLVVKIVVVSFPINSISGHKIIRENKRLWFDNFLKRNNINYETFSIPNEKFYIIGNKFN